MCRLTVRKSTSTSSSSTSRSCCRRSHDRSTYASLGSAAWQRATRWICDDLQITIYLIGPPRRFIDARLTMARLHRNSRLSAGHRISRPPAKNQKKKIENVGKAPSREKETPGPSRRGTNNFETSGRTHGQKWIGRFGKSITCWTKLSITAGRIWLCSKKIMCESNYQLAHRTNIFL